MNKRFLILLLTGFMALTLHSEPTKVLRFVPVSGAESEIPLKSLQKILFTQDSVVLFSAADGEATPLYKYDYLSFLFTESDTPQAVEPTEVQQPKTVKFIRNGQLLIRRDEQVYNIFGNKIK